MKLRWKHNEMPWGPEPVPGAVYHTMLYTIFQKPRQENTGGMVVAFTSANSGEGVTHVTRSLVNELAKAESNTVAQINARFLRKLYEPTVESLRESRVRPDGAAQTNVCDIGPTNRSLPLHDKPGRWESSWQYRRDCIDLLRREFDYAVVDCPSLRESGDVLSIAPFVDGIVMVIEANRTRAEQIRHAERNIETAQGKLLGYVLNKRTYEVPAWLYHRL